MSFSRAAPVGLQRLYRRFDWTAADVRGGGSGELGTNKSDKTADFAQSPALL